VGSEPESHPAIVGSGSDGRTGPVGGDCTGPAPRC
jgi:hypothetical protein